MTLQFNNGNFELASKLSGNGIVFASKEAGGVFGKPKVVTKSKSPKVIN